MAVFGGQSRLKLREKIMALPVLVVTTEFAATKA
jgi:hypothetical protein